MGAILAGLLCKLALSLKKFVFAGRAKRDLWRLGGTDLVHAGAALLLIGGFSAGLFSREAYITLAEGDAPSNELSDYRRAELVIALPSGEEIAVFPEDDLKPGKRLKTPAFSLRAEKFMENAKPVQRKGPDSRFKGFGEMFDLREQPPEKESEDNRAGLIFQILPEKILADKLPLDSLRRRQKSPAPSPAAKTAKNSPFPPPGPSSKTPSKKSRSFGQTGRKNQPLPSSGGNMYAVFEGMPSPQMVSWKGESYTAQLRPLRSRLPFFVELIDFERKNYPGTDQARSFQSEVYIIEGAARRRRVIKMNQPLRRKGWTLYQASFIEGGESRPETSVLAAVKNSARGFPYLASLIMCFGLAVHIAGRRRRRKAAGEKPKTLGLTGGDLR